MKVSGDGIHPIPHRHQRSAQRAPWSALVALAATMTILAAGTASAQTIENPPLLPQNLTVFPERDFTSIEGFAPNADLLVQVRRSGWSAMPWGEPIRPAFSR
jgi:hypothetical protein